VDQREIIRRSNGRRTFNLIDTLLIDESLMDARDDEARGKSKAKLNTAYDRIVRESGSKDVDGAYASEMQPHGYLIPDENGYPGLEPPMG
jgi:hypothetical protein